MALSATVLTLPICPQCDWVKRALQQADIAYTELDVSTDRAAEVMLRALYADIRRGQHPATPVTIITSDLGVETVFGPDIHSAIKRHTRAAAASTAA